MESTPGFFQKLCISAFREIPQRILWKYESDNIKDLPNNVMINKWFPQRDIIGILYFYHSMYISLFHIHAFLL